MVGGPLPSPWAEIKTYLEPSAKSGRVLSFLTGTFIERGSGADIEG